MSDPSPTIHSAASLSEAMPDLTMTQSVAMVAGMMTFLLIGVATLLIAFRVYAGREYRHNHPAAIGPEPSRPLPAALAATGSPQQRGGDPVQDVALRDDQLAGPAAAQHR